MNLQEAAEDRVLAIGLRWNGQNQLLLLEEMTDAAEKKLLQDFGSALNAPPGPRKTPSTARSSASMEKTTATWHACDGVSARRAPSASSGSARLRVRL